MKNFCVFCGNPPKLKNKEHVLPQWLLKMTGDPNRVVKFGINHSNGKEIAFSWQKLTVPSCKDCNRKYGKLEGEVRIIVEKLINKTEIDSYEAIKLLDWLDKVRIGIWINYYYLENNKAGILPRMFIEDRMGRKDRFMQVHFMESPKLLEGLNAFGVETFSFQINPSCFGLKINKVLIINGSNDFLISENCGFPYPRKIELIESGKLLLTNWEYNRSVSKGIPGIKLFKGVLTVLQPIHTEFNYNTNYFNDSYIIQRCIDREKRIGTLFRFANNEIIPIYDLNAKLYFESVKGDEDIMIGDLISKVYEAQNAFLSKMITAKDKTLEKTIEKTIELNRKQIKNLKRYHKTFI